jgi:cutinase
MRTGARAGARRASPLLVVVMGLLLAALLVAPVGPGSPAPAEAAARETTKRCADVVVLGARASGQRLTTSNRRMGPEVHAMVRNALGRLRGKHSVRLAGLPYPAVPTSSGTTVYHESVRDGARMLRGRLGRLLAACPRTRVVLAGFSQGAHVVHHAMARTSLPRSRARRVVAVGLLADPTYNRRSTHARQVRYGVKAPRHNGLIGPGRNLPPLLAKRTIDYCHPDDLVCSFDGADGEIWMARLAGRQHTAFYEQPATIAVNGRHLARVMRLHGVR